MIESPAEQVNSSDYDKRMSEINTLIARLTSLEGAAADIIEGVKNNIASNLLMRLESQVKYHNQLLPKIKTKVESLKKDVSASTSTAQKDDILKRCDVILGQIEERITAHNTFEASR